jgi:hypothetical protein
MSICTASFKVYLQFTIPKDVKQYLMTESQTYENGAEKKIGFWWIKWGKFFYIDKQCEVQEIDSELYDHDYKHAEDVEFEDSE